MARIYKRDARGRFAGGGGSSSGRPKARMQERGKNRLTRDNAGRIQGIGGSGATARGGRLRTASGKQRGAVLMKASKLAGKRSGTTAKPKGMKRDPWISKQRVIGKGEVWVGRYRNPGGKKVNAKPAAKTRKISDAKAGRIIQRIDNNRPAIRKASSSTRKNVNSIETFVRARSFLLEPSRRAASRGKSISANDSVRRAVANAKPRRRR